MSETSRGRPARAALRVRGPLPGQSAACDAVLRSLPDHFGIEESIREYVRDTDALPAFVAEESADGEAGPGAARRAAPGEGGVTVGTGASGPAWRVVGILVVKTHSPQAAEIHVMGVVGDRRHEGIGRALLAAAAGWLREHGASYLTVKTLSESSLDPGYAETRAFYAATGFVPLMELPGLWGADNPCLLMLKKL